VLRVLGLDVGSVRIGVALSDPLGITAQPLEVIERKRVDPFGRIASLVAEHEVTSIVVGWPLRLDGTEGPAVESVRQFVDELGSKVSVPIERWDERLSTAEAERIMLQGGARRVQRKAGIDKLAAALILQSYLDAKRRPS
jgi:putative holliday junction resolvase